MIDGQPWQTAACDSQDCRGQGVCHLSRRLTMTLVDEASSGRESCRLDPAGRRVPSIAHHNPDFIRISRHLGSRRLSRPTARQYCTSDHVHLRSHGSLEVGFGDGGSERCVVVKPQRKEFAPGLDTPLGQSRHQGKRVAVWAGQDRAPSYVGAEVMRDGQTSSHVGPISSRTSEVCGEGVVVSGSRSFLTSFQPSLPNLSPGHPSSARGSLGPLQSGSIMAVTWSS